MRSGSKSGMVRIGDSARNRTIGLIRRGFRLVGGDASWGLVRRVHSGATDAG